MINRPADALEIMVFITTAFGLKMSYATRLEQAFMKRLVIKMTNVPATRKLTLKFVNYLLVFFLYILKINKISLRESCLNSGN